MRFPIVAKAARILGAGMGIIAVSAAIVWPIWALATRSRRLFTLLVAAAVLLFVAMSVVRRIVRRRGRGMAR
jgi:hypothetical protein